MNFAWERLSDGVHRCRLPFLDVTVGLVAGDGGALLVDTGTTLVEASAIDDDVRMLTGLPVTRIVLTHKHFDHILGSAWFPGAEIYCAPEVAEYMTSATGALRADAVRYGADAKEVDRAIGALRTPQHRVDDAAVDIGGRTVSIRRPGRGHTDADLIVVVACTADRPIVFCGDLVEESADPVVDADSDVTAWPVTLDAVLDAGGDAAAYVPGHGAVVDAEFVRRKQEWLRERV
jgi:glyoxylase-like metal-dependent hydrolase (beta-lactamase superfamily II)